LRWRAWSGVVEIDAAVASDRLGLPLGEVVDVHRRVAAADVGVSLGVLSGDLVGLLILHTPVTLTISRTVSPCRSW
jgi:hypothetical protein